MATVNGDLADTFRSVPLLGVTRRQFGSLAETYGQAAVLSLLQGVQVFERLGIAPRLLPNQKAQVTLADVVAMLDRLYPATPVALSDGIGMTQTTVVQSAVTVLEGLGVAGALVGAAHYHLTIAETVRLASAVGQFFGVDVSEGFGILEALAGKKLAPATIAETIGMAGALSPQLLVGVTIDETIEVTPEFALCMLYDAQMFEGVEISALYFAPAGYNTWVMNTRNAGMTEYTNFPFNSFAEFGHTYLAAAADGLYELVGDTDEGADIVARIKGGFLQFGGPQLSRLKAAYLAVRGGGDFVLRIETGEGALYNYAVTAQSMHTSKVHMGKGQRARYFSYELISAGQDFDLDTLEFVPIVLQRRV